MVIYRVILPKSNFSCLHRQEIVKIWQFLWQLYLVCLFYHYTAEVHVQIQQHFKARCTPEKMTISTKHGKTFFLTML